MRMDRSAGVLLHLTSLPGNHGTGTLGDEAYRFVDLLEEGGFSYWQILPFGPVSPAMCYSPYSSLSVFAGNCMLISPDRVISSDWFRDRFPVLPKTDESFADFDSVGKDYRALLNEAGKNFFKYATAEVLEDYDSFCKQNQSWLDDYGLYMALSEKFKSHNWMDWESSTARRDEQALREHGENLKGQIIQVKFNQYIFYTQWRELKDYANSKGIKIIGDVPIYVSMNSADSWAMQHLLQINHETLEPDAVAGVPPDYFSETGQLWGNPLYLWKNSQGGLNEKTFRWWASRISHTLEMADIIRIDHFRAFESYWSVKYGEETAVNGKWIKGPGIDFFDFLKREITDIPLIAEDLGIITDEVKELRDKLNLPGMKILQFAFDMNSENEYLPHNIENRNCILYTGTHDNDTVNGWFYDPEMPEVQREYIMEYLAMKDWSDFHLRMIREAYASTADLAVIPAQDILGYGGEFRMNMPGTIENNWKWKLKKDELNSKTMKRMKRMAKMFSRLPEIRHPGFTK